MMCSARKGCKYMPNLYLGKIPRDMVTWYPMIDYSRCNECERCVDYCPHDVFEKPMKGKPKVINPNNCVVGCTGCAKVCGPRAIHFPPADAIERLLEELRQVYK